MALVISSYNSLDYMEELVKKHKFNEIKNTDRKNEDVNEAIFDPKYYESIVKFDTQSTDKTLYLI